MARLPDPELTGSWPPIKSQRVLDTTTLNFAARADFLERQVDEQEQGQLEAENLARAIRQAEAIGARLVGRIRLPQIFMAGLEKLAYQNLRKSLDPRDRRATVEIRSTGPLSFNIVVKRPEIQKEFKPSKKELMPGRYFEIHGPGGRTKVTTSVAVMEKAKKQGIHVQTKYKMPDGKTETEFSIYEARKGTMKVEGTLAKHEIIDQRSDEYKAMLVRAEFFIQKLLGA
jgi:hypothetical protein